MSQPFSGSGCVPLRSVDLASAIDRFDRDCRRFFHDSPPALKSLCRSYFPRDGEHDRSSSAGYLEDGNGAGEMFILRFPTTCDEDVPWPVVPKTFVSHAKLAADVLLETALAALCDALASAFGVPSATAPRRTADAQSGDGSESGDDVATTTVTDIERWVKGLPFHEQSIVFCRHYLAKGRSSSSGRTAAVSAHTDSGILTLVAARQSDLSFLEFLAAASEESTCASPQFHRTAGSENAVNNCDTVEEEVDSVAFFGEAAIPFAQLCASSLGLAWTSTTLSRFRAAVHQVRHERWSASLVCRHSFSLQVRLPTNVLSPSAAARPLSSLTHRILAF